MIPIIRGITSDRKNVKFNLRINTFITVFRFFDIIKTCPDQNIPKVQSLFENIINRYSLISYDNLGSPCMFFMIQLT